MDVQNILRLVLWAAVFGIAVIVMTRFAGNLAGKVGV